MLRLLLSLLRENVWKFCSALVSVAFALVALSLYRVISNCTASTFLTFMDCLLVVLLCFLELLVFSTAKKCADKWRALRNESDALNQEEGMISVSVHSFAHQISQHDVCSSYQAAVEEPIDNSSVQSDSSDESGSSAESGFSAESGSSAESESSAESGSSSDADSSDESDSSSQSGTDPDYNWSSDDSETLSHLDRRREREYQQRVANRDALQRAADRPDAHNREEELISDSSAESGSSDDSGSSSESDPADESDSSSQSGTDPDYNWSSDDSETLSHLDRRREREYQQRVANRDALQRAADRASQQEAVDRAALQELVIVTAVADSSETADSDYLTFDSEMSDSDSIDVIRKHFV